MATAPKTTLESGPGPGSQNLRKAGITFLGLTALFVVAFLALEITGLPEDALSLALGNIHVVVLMALASFVIRYLRWRYLLSSGDYPIAGIQGFLGYIAGFALTASPGKVGELLRIRYFAAQGVPSDVVVGAFFYERACDLIIVLCLAAMLMAVPVYTGIMLAFVSSIVIALFILFINAARLSAAGDALLKSGWRKLGQFLCVLGTSFRGIARWMNFRALAVSTATGVAAWGLLSIAFTWLCLSMDIHAVPRELLGIYPTAMLVGAASFIPGGIGATEAVIILLLRDIGVEFEVAAIAALTIRMGTLWFASLCGLAAVAVIESRAISARATVGPRG